MQSVTNYLEAQIPKFNNDFRPVERLYLARKADFLGKIPVIGTVVGAVRIIISIAIGNIALVAGLFALLDSACRGKKNNIVSRYSFHVLHRSVDELRRGFSELVSFTGILIYLDLTRMKREKKGVIGHETYGQYIYATPPSSGYLCYSNTKFEVAAKFIEGEEYEGDYLFFDEEYYLKMQKILTENMHGILPNELLDLTKTYVSPKDMPGK